MVIRLETIKSWWRRINNCVAVTWQGGTRNSHNPFSSVFPPAQLPLVPSALLGPGCWCAWQQGSGTLLGSELRQRGGCRNSVPGLLLRCLPRADVGYRASAERTLQPGAHGPSVTESQPHRDHSGLRWTCHSRPWHRKGTGPVGSTYAAPWLLVRRTASESWAVSLLTMGPGAGHRQGPG